jgi:hypothetical protein
MTAKHFLSQPQPGPGYARDFLERLNDRRERERLAAALAPAPSLTDLSRRATILPVRKGGDPASYHPDRVSDVRPDSSEGDERKAIMRTIPPDRSGINPDGPPLRADGDRKGAGR